MDPEVVPSGARSWQGWALIALALLPLAVLLARPPMPQDLKYHALVDTRSLFGIPNFCDVASNLAFLLVGIAGLLAYLRGQIAGAARSWAVFFAGVALVFFGSAYYHWSPSNATLVWDRVPITIAFMGLFVAVLSEHFAAGLERVMLAPAVAVGIASVAWWAHTDDLRVYYWVQATPIAATAFVLAACRGRYTHRAYLACGFVAYALAKAGEFHDREIYAVTSQLLSGHTLKHLLAALGTGFIYLMVRRRSSA